MVKEVEVGIVRVSGDVDEAPEHAPHEDVPESLQLPALGGATVPHIRVLVPEVEAAARCDVVIRDHGALTH